MFPYANRGDRSRGDIIKSTLHDEITSVKCKSAKQLTDSAVKAKERMTELNHARDVFLYECKLQAELIEIAFTENIREMVTRERNRQIATLEHFSCSVTQILSAQEGNVPVEGPWVCSIVGSTNTQNTRDLSDLLGYIRFEDSVYTFTCEAKYVRWYVNGRINSKFKSTVWPELALVAFTHQLIPTDPPTNQYDTTMECIEQKNVKWVMRVLM